MDMNKEYIEMCVGATKIQEYGDEHLEDLAPSFIYDLLLEKVCLYMWLPKIMRDRLNLTSRFHIISVEKDKDANKYIEEGIEGKLIWLPRQDQLQDMLPEYGLDSLQFSFNQWLNRIDFSDVHAFKSMEQLWLAHVMQVKYNKQWIDGEWKE